MRSHWNRIGRGRANGESSCCRSLKSCVGVPTLVSAAPPPTACLPSAHVGGHAFQTRESCRRDEFFWRELCLSSFLQHLTCALNTPAAPRNSFFFFFSSEKRLQSVASLGPDAKRWVLSSSGIRFKKKKKRKKKGNSQPRFNHTGCLVG